VRSEESSGRTAGSIYAFSTTGAIVGTFVTGYFMIEAIGMFRVVFLLSLILAVTSVFLLFVYSTLHQKTRSTGMLFVGSIVIAVAVAGLAFTKHGSGNYTMESKYYAIKVDDGELRNIPVKMLSLDKLLHSYVNLDDPLWLGYQHEEMQGEFLIHRRANGKPNMLVIGGGGYTFPRWAEITVPDASIDVVEIDPAVTKAAQKFLGLPLDSTIKPHHMDGRQFVREYAPKQHYDLIVQDAVNDLSVPYHLLTKEYNDHIKTVLKDDGIYLLTLIDSLDKGELWRAAFHTLRKTFAFVEILDVDDFRSTSGRLVYVIYASNHPIPIAEIHANNDEFRQRRGEERAQRFTHKLAPDRLEEQLNKRKAIILTDQFAPVDNLMMSIFRDR
jgi:spermidine synthase